MELSLDRPDAIYKCGEKAVFTVKRIGTPQNSESDKAVVKLSNDARDIFLEENIDLSKEANVFSGTMDKPGFLRFTVEFNVGGKSGRKDAGAAFEPEKIRPSMKKPADFDKFWEDNLKELASIPPDYQLKEIKKDKVAETYAVSAATVNGKRVYGFISIPVDKSRKYPVNFQIPSAGSGVNNPVFSKGDSIEMIVNVHDNPVGVSHQEFAANDKKLMEASCRTSDKGKCLDGCRGTFYPWFGAEDRMLYYFRPAILGLCRMVDYAAERPEFNQKEFNVIGHSQGGGMSLITSSLKQGIVTSTYASVPGMSDHAGHNVGRETGWPWMIGAIKGDSRTDKAVDVRRRKLNEELTGYYDACFFVEKLRNPVAVVCGFQDAICVPSSVYAAYNSIPGNRKSIVNAPDCGHATSEKYNAAAKDWLKKNSK